MAGVALAAVADVMSRPWAWGQADCCTAACDVFARLHGVDPMASLRGGYATRREAMRIIRSRGGWERMAAELAAAAGLRGGAGEPGEIGVTLNGARGSLVICVAPGQWAGKTASGFSTVRAVSGCWRV
ncbi:MAG: hypothetical protein VYD87_13270 [Pseudomonadota bacterium]|nr:hypothetical protein [Pseudomonadota bacterium]MEE3099888.1 hypothetical protein [Pseudomonadota bacterium]